MTDSVHAAETLEGWFALHTLVRLDRAAWRALGAAERDAALDNARTLWRTLACPPDGGWSAAVAVVGGEDEVLLIHFRPTLDAVGDAQRQLMRTRFGDYLTARWSFVSVAEVGLYGITSALTADAASRGGAVGDAIYRAKLEERVRAELAGPYIQRRLYPPAPREHRYVSFYPMSKRRAPGQNWYTLPIGERETLMRGHGLTGRRYAGRVLQLVTGAIGLADWEWGVTLFASDPIDIKRLVTEMRFDAATAHFAEFGPFHIGRLCEEDSWIGRVGSLDEVAP